MCAIDVGPLVTEIKRNSERGDMSQSGQSHRNQCFAFDARDISLGVTTQAPRSQQQCGSVLRGNQTQGARLVANALTAMPTHPMLFQHTR